MLHLSPGQSPSLADAALLRGIAAYRRHPYKRDLPDPPVLWHSGASRVLDYGGSGPAVLFVPSLINRAYILDLAPGRSLLRWLAVRGVRPLLLDWGWPGLAERRRTLSDIVVETVLPAVAAAGEPVVLAGYCMGGLLAVAAAQLAPALVDGLALLATPWDFHAGGEPQGLAAFIGTLPALLAGGTLPVDTLQAYFAMVEPGAVAAKFRAFATVDQASSAAAMFVALEDWLADGVPLPAPAARECIADWYGANTPAHGAWRIGGAIVDPTALRLPSLAILPAHDRIVPPGSARALATLLPNAAVLEPPLGHVGMVAGARAEALVWPPLLDWLRSPKRPMSG